MRTLQNESATGENLTEEVEDENEERGALDRVGLPNAHDDGYAAGTGELCGQDHDELGFDASEDFYGNNRLPKNVY